MILRTTLKTYFMYEGTEKCLRFYTRHPIQKSDKIKWWQALIHKRGWRHPPVNTVLCRSSSESLQKNKHTPPNVAGTQDVRASRDGAAQLLTWVRWHGESQSRPPPPQQNKTEETQTQKTPTIKVTPCSERKETQARTAVTRHGSMAKASQAWRVPLSY